MITQRITSNDTGNRRTNCNLHLIRILRMILYDQEIINSETELIWWQCLGMISLGSHKCVYNFHRIIKLVNVYS